MWCASDCMTVTKVPNTQIHTYMMTSKSMCSCVTDFTWWKIKSNVTTTKLHRWGRTRSRDSQEKAARANLVDLHLLIHCRNWMTRNILNYTCIYTHSQCLPVSYTHIYLSCKHNNMSTLKRFNLQYTLHFPTPLQLMQLINATKE